MKKNEEKKQQSKFEITMRLFTFQLVLKFSVSQSRKWLSKIVFWLEMWKRMNDCFFFAEILQILCVCVCAWNRIFFVIKKKKTILSFRVKKERKKISFNIYGVDTSKFFVFSAILNALL